MRARGVPQPRRGDGGRARRVRAPAPARPVMCSGGGSRQLVAHSRGPLPARPGSVEGWDRGCVRNGVADMLVAFAPLECGRHVRPAGTRTRVGLAETLRWVSDDLFPEAERIVLVCDNPDTHPVGVALRGAPAGGGRAAGLPPRGPSHAQARELVGHGGDRGRLPRAARPSGARQEFRRDGAPHGRLRGGPQRTRPDGRLEARGRRCQG